MSPSRPADGEHEQTEEERLEISRRYRARRGEQLRELAGGALGSEPLAAGEFSTVPLESLAAIPLLGAFFAFATRVRRSRKGLAPNVMLALDDRDLHLLSVRSAISGPVARLERSWPRGGVEVRSIQPRFMRDEVVLGIDGEGPLKLYANTLRTNPWASEVVRLLGGEAPEPLDLRGP